MRIALKSIFIFIFLLLPAITYAKLYHVTQNGGGGDGGDGSSSDPWSVTQFNALTGTGYAGDTFFFSGSIITAIVPQISGKTGNYVILDGYKTNDTTYMNLSEASGRAFIDLNGSDDGIRIDNVDYLIIQEFEITDCDDPGIRVTGGSHNIKIKRNYIYESRSAIAVGESSYNVTIGGELGHGNVVKNLGQGTADEDIGLFAGAHDIIVSYNHIYADDTDWGIDGILVTTGAYDVLIEYNSIHDHNENNAEDNYGEDGIDIKKSNTHNIIIRFNNIYGHADVEDPSGQNQNCITAQSGSDNVYIYGNRCHRNRAGIVTGDDEDTNDQIYIFSNVVTYHERMGILIGFQGDSYNTWVFNNTLIKNGTCTELNGKGGCDPFSSNSSWGNIAVASVESSTKIKNNILYKGRPSDDNEQQLWIAKNSDTLTTADANIFYWPSKKSKIYWGDSRLLTLAQVKASNINGMPQEDDISKPGMDRDPGLTNITGGDYTIASASSAAFNAGIDMGSGAIAIVNIQGVAYPVYWDIALGPNTDWSKTLPVVEVLRRDIVGWDIGAYAYKKIISKMTPSPEMSPPSAFDCIPPYVCRQTGN